MRYAILFIILMLGFTSAGFELCIDLDAPLAPKSIQISGSSGNILIVWSDAPDKPDCSQINYYVISRNGQKIGQTAGDVLNFTDSEKLGEGSYNYTVYAVDAVGGNSNGNIGVSARNDIVIDNEKVLHGSSSSGFTCKVNWSCGSWTDCTGGETRRICTDLNNCGTPYLKPSEYTKCEEENTPLKEKLTTNITNTKEPAGFLSPLTGAVIGGGATSWMAATLFVLVVLALFFLVWKKK